MASLNRARPTSASPDATASPSSAGFDQIYDAWFDSVRRWARAMGTPAAELDDVTQEVFLVAHRKLAQLDPLHPGPWLYRVTQNTVSSHRRQAWFRRIVMLGDPLADQLIDPRSTPAQSLESAERRRLLEQILARMNPTQRTALILFEVEQYTGEEIAHLQQVPLKTVWSRLRLARQAFTNALRRARPHLEEDA